MTRKFRELERKMSPARRRRVRERARRMMAEMVLAQLRKSGGLTQEELARRLGIKQPTLSKIEARNDMQISTLIRLIHALGGELELVARMPGGDIRVSQFKQASA